jgi:ribosome silencing factor RsfS/YbeB/iojap
MAAKKKKGAPKKGAPRKSPAKKAGAKKTPARAKKSATKRVVRKTKRPAPKRKAPARQKVAKARTELPAAPEALALARSIAHVAQEKKAVNVTIIDTRARAPSVGYDYVVLATGETDRQLSAIYEGVEELLKPQGRRAASVEASPDWVCVSYDTGVVAHFFTPDKRESTDLEGLWDTAPRVSP